MFILLGLPRLTFGPGKVDLVFFFTLRMKAITLDHKVNSSLRALPTYVNTTMIDITSRMTPWTTVLQTESIDSRGHTHTQWSRLSPPPFPLV